MSAKPEEVFLLKTQKQAAACGKAIARLVPDPDKPYVIRVSQAAESRRSKQNRLSFMWYRELGEATGHGTKHERCRCKLHYGVDILREHKDFNELWENSLDHLLYEQQFIAIENFDVTSLMSVREFAHYLTMIDQEAANMGYVLTHPDDLYWNALMKERPGV